MNNDKLIDDKLKEFQQDLAILTEAGFVAVRQFDEVNATRLFEAAQLLDANNVAPQIGMAYIAISKNDAKKGLAILSKVLEIEPNNELAQILMQMCYLISNTNVKTAFKALLKLKSNSIDPSSQTFCDALIAWCEKDPEKKQKIAE